MRWQHPERGLLPPSDFISVAEDIGTINQLGQHVLEVAVTAISSIVVPDRLRPFQLGVNISARQLGTGDLDKVVKSVLDRDGLAGAVAAARDHRDAPCCTASTNRSR